MTQPNYDVVTGQEFFKPQIKRGPIAQRREDATTIGEHLYNARAEKARAQLEAAEKEKLRMEEAKVKMSDKSQKMVNEKRSKILEELFMLMDSDDDGLISATHIDISKVPMEALEIYAPFLAEMEELNIVLDLPIFLEASDKLVKVEFDAFIDLIAL
jgi:hypothetical protein